MYLEYLISIKLNGADNTCVYRQNHFLQIHVED